MLKFHVKLSFEILNVLFEMFKPILAFAETNLASLLFSRISNLFKFPFLFEFTIYGSYLELIFMSTKSKSLVLILRFISPIFRESEKIL